jgi:hypothetical protein
MNLVALKLHTYVTMDAKKCEKRACRHRIQGRIPGKERGYKTDVTFPSPYDSTCHPSNLLYLLYCDKHTSTPFLLFIYLFKTLTYYIQYISTMMPRQSTYRHHCTDSSIYKTQVKHSKYNTLQNGSLTHYKIQNRPCILGAYNKITEILL